MIKSPSPNSSSANGGQGSSKKPKSVARTRSNKSDVKSFNLKNSPMISTSQMTEAQLHDVSSNYDSIYISQETFNDAVSSAEAAITLTLRVAKGILKMVLH
ncbi:hypothetical protein NQ317_015564 [Molorchus minor]|uniref:Uncharacterized protein n=1 Tax=Molorchus minor TaxID=1323400 RepID=A0ABQ9IQN8_9CUCU|nr:hypothetical protein NQ317_015564 [Molorchus minor]